MKMNVYAVRDSQADATMRPVFYQSDAVALRSFTLTVSDADDQMNKTPVDFTLYRIATFNDETMAMEGIDPVRLMNGLEAISNRKFDLEQISALNKEIEAIKNGEDLKYGQKLEEQLPS